MVFSILERTWTAPGDADETEMRRWDWRDLKICLPKPKKINFNMLSAWL